MTRLSGDAPGGDRVRRFPQTDAFHVHLQASRIELTFFTTLDKLTFVMTAQLPNVDSFRFKD
ncbi:hypothetical protein BA20089_00195 [Bifidobacterium asteroides DSM 20089]|uniref:Uncharacterized protein n=1 Tax=Bifidobacterium asteroides DSM 20089 TaxID=1437594 RepID=A0AAD0EUY7_9BIFI|nr:hypothetical protein BA20089_00195 [Bifidobacterium asteroides DSM 20089]PXY88748.1 hypothetical protein DKK68_00830 [Bifidobacterium asteroides]